MKLGHHYWCRSSNPTNRILLLHGMGGTGGLFRPLAAGLEDEWEVLALDQRGHGKSRHFVASPRTPIGFTPLDYGKDIVETLEELSFHPTWILGHSMGVRSSVATAYLKPDWVKGLILIDLGFSGPAGGGLGENLAQFLRILPKEFKNREEAKTFLYEHCPDPSIAQYLMAVSAQEQDCTLYFPFDSSILIQTIEAARVTSVRDWLRALGKREMPIRVLRGEKSLVWSREDFEKEKTDFKSYPSIQFIEFNGATHGLPFEQRLKLVTFIKKLEESPS